MPKSPQYLPMPTTGCGVQEAALIKPVNVFWVFTFLEHFALLQASKKLHAFLAVSYGIIANLCTKMARLSDLDKNLCSSSHLKCSV
jgi:hypothetical protein